MLLRALLVLIIILLSLEVEAGTVNLLGRPIDVVIPTGYCVIGGHPADAIMINRTKEGVGPNNQMLTLFADCKELEDFRKGRRTMLDNYGHILAQPPKGKLRSLKGISRSEYIQKISETSGYQPEALEKAAARIKQYFPEYQSHESLGLLSTDSNGAYMGLLATMTDDTGRPRTIIGVVGATLVKELSFTINLYQAYTDSMDLHELLSRLQSATARFVLANR